MNISRLHHKIEERAATVPSCKRIINEYLQPTALDLDCVVEMSQRLSAVLNVEVLISSFLELVVTHSDATKVSLAVYGILFSCHSIPLQFDSSFLNATWRTGGSIPHQPKQYYKC